MASPSRNMIKRLIRWCRVSRDDDDSGSFPIQQVSYLGKVGDAFVLFPYGFHANVPTGELALLLNLQGNPEARVALPTSPLKRVKVAAGEVVVFHPPSGSKIHFKADGTIEMTASNVKVIGDLEVTGSTVLSATVTSNGKDISDTHTHVGSPTAPDGPVSNTGVPV